MIVPRRRTKTRRRHQHAPPFTVFVVPVLLLLLMQVMTTTMTSGFLGGVTRIRGNNNNNNNNNHISNIDSLGFGGSIVISNRLRRPCHLGPEDSATSLCATFLFPTIPVVSSSLSTSLSVLSHEVSIPQLVLGLVGVFSLWLYLDGGDDRMRERNRLAQEEAYNKYKLEQYQYCHVEYQEHGWSLDEIAKYKEGTRPKIIEEEREEVDEAASNGDSSNTVDNPTDTATEYYDGPILLAVDGTVYNVYKGRNFYGPGGEYAIFAGRDATRLLAKGKLDEETTAEQQQPLNIAERAVLATWIYTFQNKYDIVGPLHDYDGSKNSL